MCLFLDFYTNFERNTCCFVAHPDWLKLKFSWAQIWKIKWPEKLIYGSPPANHMLRYIYTSRFHIAHNLMLLKIPLRWSFVWHKWTTISWKFVVQSNRLLIVMLDSSLFMLNSTLNFFLRFIQMTLVFISKTIVNYTVLCRAIGFNKKLY